MHTRRADTFPLSPAATAAVAPLTRGWWLVLLRGIAGILFGIAAFIWPGLTVLALTLLFGAFAWPTASSPSAPRSRAAATSRSPPGGWH